MKNPMRVLKGFTLPEVLVVIGIIAILAVIVIIAIDPVKRFNSARDSRRLTDIQAIASSIHQYTIDHKGSFPPGLDDRERQIGSVTLGCTLSTNHCGVKNDTDCIDLREALKPYLHGIPSDPEKGTEALTHYSARVGTDNAVIVESCDLTE